ncbi:MAG: methyltransferase domain-containing protein [Sphingomonas sp.]|nr:methyltransferase domain-containing protein [Sphingomonas sp.]
MRFDRHLLVRLFGFRGAFLHGDTLVADRWRFLRRHLPLTRNGETLLDVGCGSGLFTIGAAKRGYQATGLSWDERNQQTAQTRAQICGVPGTSFPIQDLRDLDRRDDLKERFDVVLNCENIEHILNDDKLMRDIAGCLKPGGRLLFTSPFYYYHALSSADYGPFSTEEDGGHVRRGYTIGMLRELCDLSGLMIEEVTTCSGFFSQQVCKVHRLFLGAGWLAIIPLRWMPRLFDSVLMRFGLRGYSICMVAYKPRFGSSESQVKTANAAQIDVANI